MSFTTILIIKFFNQFLNISLPSSPPSKNKIFLSFVKLKSGVYINLRYYTNFLYIPSIIKVTVNGYIL